MWAKALKMSSAPLLKKSEGMMMVSCLKSKPLVLSLTSFVFVEVAPHPINLRMGVRCSAQKRLVQFS